MEISNIFKDKAKKEGDGVTDLIMAVVRLLRWDRNRLVKAALEELELAKGAFNCNLELF